MKQRNLAKLFNAEYKTNFKNLLVNGCSFTWNNSEEHICSWPYYLRDLMDFNNVFDCSQSGAGTNHIFNSTVNELEKNIDPNDTFIIIVWSGLTRTDVIAETSITKNWHNISNYSFNNQYSTLSIFNSVSGNREIDKLCRQYKLIVSADAQIYESALKIIALKNYLENKNFNFVFAQYQDLTNDIEILPTDMKTKLNSCFDELISIGSHSKEFEEDGHPTPDSYLSWTKQILIPYLLNKYPTLF